MQDEMKSVGLVAAIGAAAGAGLALGVGLRLFSTLAMVDGRITVHDLQGRGPLPGTIVLSACSVAKMRLPTRKSG